MTYEWNKDYNRFSIARNILLQIMDSIYMLNNEVEFGVRIYGSEFPAQQKNCTDSRLLVNFNLQNVNQIKQALNYATPIGWSPIAYSLEKAAFGEINNTDKYDYSIIFITDGGESCNGDICKTYTRLLQEKISVTPYIIGLDKNNTLKTYYDCLGKYVSVTETVDIPKAVRLIIDENRPLINKKKKLNLKTVFSNMPIKSDSSEKKKDPVVKVIPIKRPVADNLYGLNPYPLRPISRVPIKKYSPKGFYPPIAVEVPINFQMEEPVVNRPPDFYARLKRSPLRPLFVSRFKKERIISIYQPIAVSIPINFEMEKPVPARKADTYRRITSFPARHRYVYAYQLTPFKPAVPPFSKVEYKFNYTPIERKIVVIDRTKNPISRPTPTKIMQGPNTKVSRELVPSEETMVQVFFVNKFQKNKMYKSATPRIYVTDASTKKPVTNFIRSTRGGTPDMKPIKSGTYNFTVRGRNNLVTPDVRIDANHINKVFIEVSDGSIRFAYRPNKDRPVKEYQAKIYKRFAKKREIFYQECVDKIYYEPGTYYIEINTLPITKWAMTELDFGQKMLITVEEPGFLQINNTNRLGAIEFYKPSNDNYTRFHDMRIQGNVIDQKLELLPGNYKVTFDANPSVPALGKKTLIFTIKSNKTTQLLLE